MSIWEERYASAVTSVNGATGDVVVTAASIGAVANTGDETIAGDKTFSGIIAIDTIDEKTAGHGVNIDSVEMLDGGVIGAKARITPEGGLAVLMVAGEALNVGEIVYSKISSGADGKVWKAPANSEMPIGICYASALINADVWIVVSGITLVLPLSSITAVRGNVLFVSATAGRADQASTTPTTEHWRECGHWIDTGAGNGVATRAVIHFN